MILKKAALFFVIVFWFSSISAIAANDLSSGAIVFDVHNKERLQRGAMLFMNYCAGCHSLKYLRYDRMALDLGLTTSEGQLDEKLLKNNLIFTQATPYSTIQVTMPAEDAKQWFGIVPPDLSLSAREKGPIWVFRYLKGFYTDPSRPFGVNNVLVPNTAMPDILESVIGEMISAPEHKSLLVENGGMSTSQIDSMLDDLVTFLVYVGEPAQLIRYQIGLYVVGFLCILLLVIYLLKKIYWRRL